jgi:putative tricarboxylic transport membrane protein
MDAINGLMMGFSVLFTAENLYFCLLGSIVGTLVGVLPGIGPLAALALLLPVTFQLSAVAGLGMLAAIFYGAMYGGSTTSILVNIPGEAASVVTALDGHAMAKQGRAGAALGMAAISSFVAGTLSLVALTFFSPLLATVALKFGPPENFALMVLGLVCTLYMIGGSKIKGVLMIALGFLAAIVGIDIVNGQDRFTLGTVNLSAGIEILSVVIGLYGVSEILMNCETIAKNQVLAEKIKGLWPTFADWKASWKPMMRGSFLGFFLGLVPGGGPVTASFVSYTLERRMAKDPERFGKGAIAGVAGPESANNSAAQTSFIPLLTLGIPTNSVMALLIGALIVQGIQPGPMVIKEQPALFWGLIASMWVGNLMLLIINLPLVGIWIKLLKAPHHYLYPVILLLCAVGAYSLANNNTDVLLMVIFGVLGYFLIKAGFEPAPLILGFVLGPMMEENLRRAMTMSFGDPTVFFTRPISLGILLFTLGSFLLMTLPGLRKKRQEAFIEEQS